MPTFATPEPIAITLDIVGDARITASDRTDTVVEVRPRTPSRAADVKAAEETVVVCRDGRLEVRSPKHWRRFSPFGGSELVAVTIEVPTGSSLDARTEIGDLRVEGEVAACRLKTSMGDIRVDRAGATHAHSSHGDIAIDRVVGDAEISTSSGDVRIGEIDGGAVIKSSNGDTTVATATGHLRVTSANGDIRIGRAPHTVVAKTAHGDVRIVEVSEGTVVMETAAGGLEVGIREGTAAWLDVSTSFGSVRNTLGAAEGPEESERTVEVRARTSFGDITIARSTADAVR